jgi:hypothetical protein
VCRNCACVSSTASQVSGKIIIHKVYLEMSTREASHTKYRSIYRMSRSLSMSHTRCDDSYIQT